MTKLTIKDILAEHINELVPIPPQTKMVKIEKSDSRDVTKRSTTEFDPPYCGVARWEFEHILKIPGQNIKRYAGGGISVVKKGFGGNLVRAIKILKEKDEKIRVNRAEREAKYNALLEREVTWGAMNNKFYIGTPWFNGMNMHDYAKHLKQHAQDSKYVLPFKKPQTYTLLRMFRYYLKQAKIFHDLGLILQDPKSGNAMVVDGNIEIFDFDAVHPIGTQENTHTRAYLPPDLIARSSEDIGRLYTQADDIYIFGLMLAELFPKVFNIIHTERKPTEIKVIAQESSRYKALENLVLQMTHTDHQQRPLITDCLESVEALLKIHTPKSVPEVKGKDKMDLLSEKLEERKKKVLLGDLCLSIINDKTEKTQVILSACPELLNTIHLECESQTTTPLTLALAYKRIEIVEFAFKHALEAADFKHVDFILKSDLSKQLVNKKLMQDRLPLAMACELKENGDGDKEKIIDALLENGAELEDSADLSLCNERFLTKLLYNALQNSDVARNPALKDSNEWRLPHIWMTELQTACQTGDEKRIKQLAECDRRLLVFTLKKDEKDPAGTALHFTAAGNPLALNAILELLEKRQPGLAQAGLLQRNEKGQLPFHLALLARQNAQTLIKIMTWMGKHVDQIEALKDLPAEFSRWPLNEALTQCIEKKDEDKIRCLRRMGAEPLNETDFQMGLNYFFSAQSPLALPYFRKAMQLDYPPSWLFSGIIYKLGLGSLKIELLTKSCFRRAEIHQAWFHAQASTGNPISQFYLGIFCQYLEKNVQQAVAWYHKAAEQGYPNAQFYLGFCYGNSLCVVKDEKEAVAWYRKAAEQGHPSAQNNLGVCYESGKGVVKDEKEAAAWYRKAAEQGDPSAQYHLGCYYESGIDVKKNNREAISWYQKAAAQKYEKAKNAITMLLICNPSLAQNLYTTFSLNGVQREADRSQLTSSQFTLS